MTGLTKEQQEIRKRGIGGSEVAAVVGLHPYATALDVWMKKRELVDDEDNPAMMWGRRLEASIADHYAELHDCRLVDPRQTLIHPSRPIAVATPDRLRMLGPEGDVLDRVVEIKTAGDRQAWRWGDADSEEVPEHYLIQLQWELAVVGAARGDLVVLIGGRDYREYHFERDDGLIGDLLDSAERFWSDHVEADRPPALDGSKSSGEYLRARHPRSLTPPMASTPEIDELVALLARARRDHKRVSTAEVALEHRLQQLMGDAEAVTGNWGVISWKSNRQGNVKWKDVAEQLREAARLDEDEWAACQAQNRSRPSRPFTPRLKDDEEDSR